MDCKEAKSLIEAYIEHKIPAGKLPQFLDHMQQCKTCLDDLQVQYAICTAIEQLNRGEDFSDDYNSEVQRDLAKNRQQLMRHARKIRFLRVVTLLLFVVSGFAIGLTNTKNVFRTYLPSTQESRFSLDYYGIDRSRDPVYQAIQKYNEEVIAKLRELEAEQNKELPDEERMGQE